MKKNHTSPTPTPTPFLYVKVESLVIGYRVTCRVTDLYLDLLDERLPAVLAEDLHPDQITTIEDAVQAHIRATSLRANFSVI